MSDRNDPITQAIYHLKQSRPQEALEILELAHKPELCAEPDKHEYDTSKYIMMEGFDRCKELRAENKKLREENEVYLEVIEKYHPDGCKGCGYCGYDKFL